MGLEQFLSVDPGIELKLGLGFGLRLGLGLGYLDPSPNHAGTAYRQSWTQHCASNIRVRVRLRVTARVRVRARVRVSTFC